MWCPSFVKQFVKFVLDEMEMDKKCKYVLLYVDDDEYEECSIEAQFESTSRTLPKDFYDSLIEAEP
jgi:hypothetical protein